MNTEKELDPCRTKYRCCACGHVMELDEVDCTHFNHNCPMEDDPGPDYSLCSHCGYDELDDVNYCFACKEWKSDTTLMEDGGHMCEDCTEDDYWRAVEEWMN